MPTRHVIISTHNGVHARPVAELVRLARAHDSSITLRTADGTEVDLTSILAVMELALSKGDEVMLSTVASAEAHGVLESLAGVLDPATT